MTSPTSSTPAHEELLWRANKLVDTRGTRRPYNSGPICLDYHMGRDEFGDEFIITKYLGSKLTIYRQGAVNGPVISLNLTNGEVAGHTHPHPLRTILQLARQLMVLEDMADV